MDAVDLLIPYGARTLLMYQRAGPLEADVLGAQCVRFTIRLQAWTAS